MKDKNSARSPGKAAPAAKTTINPAHLALSDDFGARLLAKAGTLPEDVVLAIEI